MKSQVSHKPKWFKKGKVIISNANTCGINKDGADQFLIDVATGNRLLDRIDDELYEDCRFVATGIKHESRSVKEIDIEEVTNSRILVPNYHNHQSVDDLIALGDKLPGFTFKSLGQLEEESLIFLRQGHGSPSSDQRVGDVPYIKVSDLRAGRVNINPTNMIPLPLAEKYWRGSGSGLEKYDLLSPERASKNIGEFCVLLPGQEDVVLTKEIIVVRSLSPALFDQFYLLWALTLDAVREQWNRIILMQTNREDVGSRYKEIVIPVPPNLESANKISASFREYFESTYALRKALSDDIKGSIFSHHFFV